MTTTPSPSPAAPLVNACSAGNERLPPVSMMVYVMMSTTPIQAELQRRSASEHCIAGIIEESPACLAAQVTGGDHAFHQRRARRARIVRDAVQRVTQQQLRVEPYQVEQFERSHRIAEPGFDRAIDVGGLRYTGLDQADRVVVERHQKVIQDETGVVLGPDRRLPHRFAEIPRLLERFISGPDPRRHLDQLHQLRRQAEMHAEDAVVAPGSRGNLGDRQRRSVGSEQRVRRTDFIEFAEHLVLDLEVFEHRLDHDGCDIVIEAVFENLKVKHEVLGELNKICPPHTLFASNTSTLSITEIAAGSGRDDRVLGMHFCLPAQLMKLVEMSPGIRTADESFQQAWDFCKAMGQTPFRTKDNPGFILNYFLVPFNNDAIRLVETGVAEPADIDRAIKVGLGYPMGPLELLDLVGLDTQLLLCDALYGVTHDPRAACPPLVKRMIAAGHLGRKTGRGFFNYSGNAMFGG